MERFSSQYLFEIGLFIAVLFFISLFSIPSIFWAQKEPLLFSDFFSKRALFFSIGNAIFITLILVAISIFITITIPDENAGGAMMFLVRLAIKIGIGYGFIFPYLVLFAINKIFNK